MSDIRNLPISIPQIANIIATKDASSPLYLKGPELVNFFNGLGFADTYTFVEGRGIQTPDFGEGLSRLNYTLKRLKILYEKQLVPEAILRFSKLFEHQKEAVLELNKQLARCFPETLYSTPEFSEGSHLSPQEEKIVDVALISHASIVEVDDTNDEDSSAIRQLEEQVLGQIPEGHPVVFISYSWDTPVHQEWVGKLADDLTLKGIYVLYDGYNADGVPLDQFMEFGIRRADKIIVIGTPTYYTKYYSLDTGVAFEGCILRANIIQCIGTTKVIPCLRRGEFNKAFPILFMSRKGHNFIDDSKYESELDSLCREIWARPKRSRPAIGQIPNYV